MEIKLNVDEARLLKLVVSGTSEKEMATEFIREIKQEVREKLVSVIRTITGDSFKKIISKGLIEEILKNELKPTLVRYLKETLDDLDLSDLLIELIQDNVVLKGSINLK